MNGFINMFSQTNMSEVPCIFIYAAKRKETKTINQETVAA